MHHLILITTLCISLIQTAFIHSSQSSTNRLLQRELVNQNLLRFDSSLELSSSTITACLTWTGFTCSQCCQGFTLTNGKCYQTIANCIVQYTNICSSCQVNYRPITSLQNLTGQPSTYIITCVPTSTPQINSSEKTNTNNQFSINPLILLARQPFISWTNIQIRYPTDIYLIMIWNFLDGNQDLRVKINIKQSVITSAVRGRVRNSTADRLAITNWVVQNQLVNFLQGHLVDIQNIYFYRLRYRVRVTQVEYEVLVMIHEVNFMITLLQHLLVPAVNDFIDGGNIGNVPIVNTTLNESDQVKALRQEILDLKMQASQQRQLYKQRQLLLLFFTQYSLLSPKSIKTDPGCIVIKTYLDNKFNDFIKLLDINSTPNPGIYAWMNMQVTKVYFKRSDSINREYLFEIQFTDDVVVMVQFVVGRLFEVVDLRVVFNR